jgi:leucyl-tRNA synthetase/very-short-patch-repair endonuclease
MEYDFNLIEKKWQQKWKDTGAYKVSNESDKPSFYVLDMFPYPSGAGLHVGHPLGYIASDIFSRYKRLKGFNVLHPMGFDSFGLPAEQYALETGQHPAVTTEKNIETFKAQLDKIGFCYDWSREVRTSDPSYYKWTQKIFLELFNSYFCTKTSKAKPIAELVSEFETVGLQTTDDRKSTNIGSPSFVVNGPLSFSAAEWNAFDTQKKEEILMTYRLAFSKYGEVNWCEALGTVLANDEVVNGVSERGGHPVEKKKMRQWYLRITAYAERLLQGLDTVDFSDAMKEMQRNWIGKSEGCEMQFVVNGERTTDDGQQATDDGQRTTDSRQPTTDNGQPTTDHRIDATHVKEGTVVGGQSSMVGSLSINVYTTRPDTIFGVDFLVLAPEHELVQQITTVEQKQPIEEYLTYVKSRSDRERQAEVKQITGCFTGAYATNLFNGKLIPIWIAEYVLAGYGTGAIMAVPCGDQRDFNFAKHFNIPITNIIGTHFSGTEANATKDAILENSDFLNGMLMKDAIAVAINKIEELGIGKRKVNYKMRDAGFSRQRYWGEPFPIIWQEGVAIALTEDELPLELPYAEKYGPGPNGEGPLANMVEWTSSPSLLHRVEKGDKKIEASKNITPNIYEGQGEENLTPTLSKGEGVAKNEANLNLTPTLSKGEGDEKIEADENITPNSSPEDRELLDLSEDLRIRGYMNSTFQEWKNTFEFAKQNRKNLTEAEDKIWQLVRNRNIDNYKFRRQHPIAGFIPDFVCLEKKLIIEIDGGYHNEKEQIIFDEAREKWLKEFGFDVIRFTNEQVLENISEVKKAISEKLKTTNKNPSPKSSPAPLPRRGGGEVSLRRETSTMPGYAGSSWYFLRYMDPHNTQTFCDRKASDYWNQVDVYVGGTEHAVGHLLYSRMWTKVLYDLGYIGFDEPFKKLVNQGMIQGSSRFVYRVNIKIPNFIDPKLFKEDEILMWNKLPFISKKYYDSYDSIETKNLIKGTINKIFIGTSLFDCEISEPSPIRVHVNFVDGFELDINSFKKWKNGEYANAEFILEDDGKYICGAEVEKMSKSKYNTVNPDELCDKYGADTFRMYEMFLGPVEQSKPWDTKGIEGVHRFLKKLWRLFFADVLAAPLSSGEGSGVRSTPKWNNDTPTELHYKILHKTIKKIEQDTANFSYNTAVAAFMIAVNELTDAKCHSKEILSQVLILLSPYAPHIAEELWAALGCEGSILNATYPVLDEKYLVEATKDYPVSINGKMRSTITLVSDVTEIQAQDAALANENISKWLEGKEIKKFIFVKNKVINIVV